MVEREERKLTDLQTELAEKKERQKESQFAKKVLHLQQATLPLQIDVTSTRDHFKGCILIYNVLGLIIVLSIVVLVSLFNGWTCEDLFLIWRIPYCDG